MTLVDIIWMVGLMVAALYIIYRSVWKKKGYCQGCNSDTCSSKKVKL